MGSRISAGQSQTVGAEVGSFVGTAVVGAAVGSLVVGGEVEFVVGARVVGAGDTVEFEFVVEFIVGAGDKVGAGAGDTVEFAVSVAFARVI